MPYIYELTQLKSPGFPFQIVLYLFFSGIAAGAYLVSALIQAYGGERSKAGLHRAYYITFVLMPVCGLLQITKLERMERFTHVLWQNRDGTIMLNPNSPMSLGAWVLSIFAVIATISVLYALKKDNLLQFGWAKKLFSIATALHEGKAAKVYLTIGSFFAAWFSVYLGVLITTSNLPAWNATPFIPTVFITTAVATGVAVVLLMLALSKRNSEYAEYMQGLRKVLASAIVLNILAVVVFVFGLGQWSVTVNGGIFGLLLWGGTVVLGLIIPLLLSVKPLLGARVSLIASSILILVGGFILRYVVINGPQSFW